MKPDGKVKGLNVINDMENVAYSWVLVKAANISQFNLYLTPQYLICLEKENI